jgi:hypothetical protein
MTCAMDKSTVAGFKNIENKILPSGQGILECFLHRGQNFGTVRPAILKIPLTVQILQNDRVIFWVAVVINPKLVGLATGFKLKIMTPSSRGDNKHLIPIYQAEDHYYTTALIDPINYLNGRGNFSAYPDIVTLPANHSFILNFTQPVLNTDTILIKYPNANHRLTP